MEKLIIIAFECNKRPIYKADSIKQVCVFVMAVQTAATGLENCWG